MSPEVKTALAILFALVAVALVGVVVALFDRRGDRATTAGVRDLVVSESRARAREDDKLRADVHRATVNLRAEVQALRAKLRAAAGEADDPDETEMFNGAGPLSQRVPPLKQ